MEAVLYALIFYGNLITKFILNWLLNINTVIIMSSN